MTARRNESIAHLNDLIEICSDAEKGFSQAARRIEEPNLKSHFMKYANERGTFASQLKTEVARLGGEPSDGGTVSGKAHRAWMKVREVIGNSSKEAIVNECERGEDEAVEAYRKALARPLPNETKGLVSRQFEFVRDAHNHLSALKSTVGNK